MRRAKLKHCFLFCPLLLVTNVTWLHAQVVETVGSRALGMGGAFVAVASDSSATWWNPAGLAEGPFVDVAVARAVTESSGALPARRDTGGWVALGTPPFGFSYYRLRLTDIAPSFDPTVTESGNREDRRAQVPVRSVAASQLGATIVQTLLPGVHAGATAKYVWGTPRIGVGDSLLPPEDLLDQGDDLEGGDSDNAFGLDVGLIGVLGPVRAGLLVRNAVEAELENVAGSVRFERQYRVGFAYDAERAGGTPLTVAFDADVSTLPTATGDRRNIAIGAEQWLWTKRLGIRGGARFNTVGAKERAATGGVSVAVRAGLFVDAHIVGGGSDDDRGWGVATRVSF
jgi:hypothetical protein